jgi:hypothetical protein
MNLRSSCLYAACALSLLAAPETQAQTSLQQLPTEPAAPQAAPASPQTTTNLPDACKLLQQADLEALFPGRPIASKGPMLSPVYKGPQYNQACTYTVKLPSPTSKSELTKFASVNIVQWGEQVEGRNGSIATFANIRSTREKLAADPKLNIKVEPLSGVGDEALLETATYKVTISARKADMIYIVTLDSYSPQTQPNAVALATQAAKRWSANVGMVDTASPVAANTTVDIPEDKRVTTAAPADQWPDACALLAPEDVRAVFGDMTIDPPQKRMGQLKHESRIDRVENLPKPISCIYQAQRSDLVDGKRRIVSNSVQMNVTNMAATEELAKRNYAIARKVGDAKTDVAGIGDEASIAPLNAIYIRKGLLTVELRVGGDSRDRALYDDATRRVNELAKRVSAKLP